MFRKRPAVIRKRPRSPYISSSSVYTGGNTIIPAPTPAVHTPNARGRLLVKVWPITTTVAKVEIPNPSPDKYNTNLITVC